MKSCDRGVIVLISYLAAEWLGNLYLFPVPQFLYRYRYRYREIGR